MTCLQALILGIVDSITSLLPLSAPAHLAILRCFFAMPSEQEYPALALMIRLGTLIGLCFASRRRLWTMLRGIFGFFDRRRSVRSTLRGERRLLLLVIAGTLPLLLVLPFRAGLQDLSNDPLFIGGMLLLGGLALFLSGRVHGGDKDHRSATLPDALLIGLGQAVGMVPGLGRGLGCVTVGLGRRLDRQFAVEFSLLLAVASVFGAGIFDLAETVRFGLDTGLIPQYLIGMAAALAAGYGAACFLRALAKHNHLGNLCYYCWGLGLVTLGLGLIV